MPNLIWANGDKMIDNKILWICMALQRCQPSVSQTNMVVLPGKRGPACTLPFLYLLTHALLDQNFDLENGS